MGDLKGYPSPVEELHLSLYLVCTGPGHLVKGGGEGMKPSENFNFILLSNW